MLRNLGANVSEQPAWQVFDVMFARWVGCCMVLQSCGCGCLTHATNASVLSRGWDALSNTAGAHSRPQIRTEAEAQGFVLFVLRGVKVRFWLVPRKNNMATKVATTRRTTRRGTATTFRKETTTTRRAKTTTTTSNTNNGNTSSD